MKCPDCGGHLGASRKGGVEVQSCPRCDSTWVAGQDFPALRGSADRFVRWLDPDLWSDIGKHAVRESARTCPACGKRLCEVRYADSEIVIDVCPPCRGIWLHGAELRKIIAYLEGIVDRNTIRDYLKGLGHETAGILAHQDAILTELGNLGILMRLLEYRVIARFPALSRLAAQLPPV